MPRLIYSAISSLDGYIEDERGSFDWAVPDEAAHAFINELERSVGTYLYGRRMYETMRAWESDEMFVAESAVTRDFAQIWRRAEKIVFSTTLGDVSTRRTRVERSFDPEQVRQLKSAADSDISIGGPGLAAQAFEAGLVDECSLFVAPVVVGRGKRALPDAARVRLELLDERSFPNGMVRLHYAVVG